MLTVNRHDAINRFDPKRNRGVSFKGSAVINSSIEKNTAKPAKGIISKTTKVLWNGIVGATEKVMRPLAGTGLIKTLSEKLNLNSFNKHIMPLSAIGLTLGYIGYVNASDKIEEDRKKTLSINMGIVGSLSTIFGYFIDGKINKKVDKFIDGFSKANPDFNYRNLKKGIKAAKGIIIFGLIYRFISPVFATPAADVITKKFLNKNNKKEEENIFKQSNDIIFKEFYYNKKN